MRPAVRTAVVAASRADEPLADPLAVTPHDEQRVIHRQTETERGGEVLREDGHVGELGDQPQHRRGADQCDDPDQQRQ